MLTRSAVPRPPVKVGPPHFSCRIRSTAGVHGFRGLGRPLFASPFEFTVCRPYATPLHDLCREKDGLIRQLRQSDLECRNAISSLQQEIRTMKSYEEQLRTQVGATGEAYPVTPSRLRRN